MAVQKFKSFEERVQIRDSMSMTYERRLQQGSLTIYDVRRRLNMTYHFVIKASDTGWAMSNFLFGSQQQFLYLKVGGKTLYYKGPFQVEEISVDDNMDGSAMVTVQVVMDGDFDQEDLPDTDDPDQDILTTVQALSPRSSF